MTTSSTPKGLPRVSVVMSAYNCERTVKKTIQSILNQTFRDFELIIIEDGSTDATREVIEAFSDPRLKMIVNNANIGLTRSLNVGIAVARGNYIARIDADDIALPERLSEQVSILDANQEYVLVGSNVILWEESSGRCTICKCPESDSNIRLMLLAEPAFIHPAVTYRARPAGQRVEYDEAIRYAQDYEFYIQLLTLGKGYNIQKPLTIWRIGGTNVGVAHSAEQATSVANTSLRELQRNAVIDERTQEDVWRLIYLCRMRDPAAVVTRKLLPAVKKILWHDRSKQWRHPAVGVFAASRCALASFFLLSPLRRAGWRVSLGRMVRYAALWPSGLALAVAYRLIYIKTARRFPRLPEIP